MARLTPEERAEKQINRLSAATEDIRKGVERVTEAPGAKAAKQQQKMRTKLLAKIDDGTWAKRVASVPLEDWKRLMIEKGVANIPTGIAASRDKLVKFASQQLAYQDRIDRELKGKPSVTLEDNINRMIFQVREMAKFSFER